MSIMLGNLSSAAIEDRLGIKFPDEIKKYMDNNRQLEASNIKAGKWHCFDTPFTIVCGDYQTAEKIYNSVKDQSGLVKEQLQFAIGG